MRSAAQEAVCVAKSTPVLPVRTTSFGWLLEYKRRKNANLCVKRRLTAISTHGKCLHFTPIKLFKNPDSFSSRYDTSEALANLCLLLSDCRDQVTDCTGCFSGPPRCSTVIVTNPPKNGKWRRLLNSWWNNWIFSHNCDWRNNVTYQRSCRWYFKISAGFERGWVPLVLSAWPSWLQSGSHPVWPDHLWRILQHQVLSDVWVWPVETSLEPDGCPPVPQRLAHQHQRDPPGRHLHGAHLRVTPVQWRISGVLST